MGFKTRAPTRRFALELRPGLWGAAQQVASTDGRFRALALDWFGPTPPITAELAGCRPLLADHHSWDPAALLLVLDAAPDGLRPIDSAAAIVAPRPLRVERNAASFRRQLSAQWRWRCLPEAHRRGYKRARARFDDSIEIAVGADQPPQTVRAGVTRLRVATASPRWRALDALGALTEIDFEGDDPGLVEHLEHRPLIETLGWSSDQIRELDLRRTGLLSVRLATPALERLRLPAACESLRLQAAASLRVDQEGDGDGLVLIAFGSLGSLRTLFGLERLRRIEILFAREHDCAELARFPHLERVRFHEVERLRSFASLAALPRLRRLEIRSCYDLDVELAPPLSSWPALEQLSIDGLRAERRRDLQAPRRRRPPARAARRQVRGVAAGQHRQPVSRLGRPPRRPGGPGRDPRVHRGDASDRGAPRRSRRRPARLRRRVQRDRRARRHRHRRPRRDLRRVLRARRPGPGVGRRLRDPARRVARVLAGGGHRSTQVSHIDH